MNKNMNKKNTSWGNVAEWYDRHLKGNNDTYHTKIIFPNLLRILGDIKGKKILDLGCGQGMFSELLRDNGAIVTGIDAGKELINIAEENSKRTNEKKTNKVTYYTTSAEDLFMLKHATFDIVVCVLALQNIEYLQKTFDEVKRVLKVNGTFIFVLNHPSFRIPKESSWGIDTTHEVQYRRIDAYMSESQVKIDMTPGNVEDKKYTMSFHRPLQVYVKALSKVGMHIIRLEEWISDKSSEKGPHKKREDKARKEFPLFMCITAKACA